MGDLMGTSQDLNSTWEVVGHSLNGIEKDISSFLGALNWSTVVEKTNTSKNLESVTPKL